MSPGPQLRSLLLAVLLAAPAVAVPDHAPDDKVLAWLPISGTTIGVRLTPDADLTELEALLSGGTRLRSAPIWRVPASRAAALRSHPDVLQIWGMPEPAPPPDAADLPPTTPDFAAEQTWRSELGVSGMGWWPGGLGEGVRVVDIEYDYDPAHEDLTNNPPLRLSGQPLGEYLSHGNACLGLVAASDDGFGITGGAPLAEPAVVHPIHGNVYDVAVAIETALPHLQPGDVLLIEQQIRTELGLGPVSSEPGVWEAIDAAVQAGVHVIEPAGNGAVDLDDPVFEGWFSSDNDPGSIMVGGASPGTSTWNGRSSYGTRIHLHAQAGGMYAPSHPDGKTDAFFPDGDARQVYTRSFGGTSGASALVAGLVAGVSATAKEVRGVALPPRQLRSWLVATGSPQDGHPAVEHAIGVRPNAERAVRAWLAW